MPGENYDEYRVDNSDVTKSEIDSAINHAKSDLGDLQSEVLWWKKVDFKTPDSINHFYELDEKWWEIIFKLNQVKSYLNDVYKRLSWMKSQRFWDVSKENNFTWTILAIQIALKSIDPKKYNIKINWKYNDNKEDPTRNAIQKFQTDCKLKWKDGKPGKETIWRLTTELNNFIENRKLEKAEQEKVRNDVKKVIEDSFKTNATAWLLYNNRIVDEMTDYIIEGKLWTWWNIEKDIIVLSKGPFNQKLQYLVNHPEMPIAQALKIAEEEQNKRDNQTRKLVDSNWWLGDKWEKKETSQKWPKWWPDKYTFWHNLTEAQKGTISNVLWWWKSPVTAKMVADSCQNAKNVPVEYLLAFMQNDSRVWTMWRWARTHNPWNVGNTNTWTKDWWSWEKWVDACAKNLQKRIDAYLSAKAQHNGKWFNDFPAPEELATWKSKWWYRFFWIYMSAPSGPKMVAWMVKTWVNRLRWK